MNIVLLAVGDIGFGGRLRDETAPGTGADPFLGAAAALEGADILFGNLETPLVPDGHEPSQPEIRSGFAGRPEHAGRLARSGFTIVSLANNHIMDYGPAGLQSTLKAVGSQGILAVGAGENLEEARRAVTVTKGGDSVAFLAYAVEGAHTAGARTPGAAPLVESLVLEDVARAGRSAGAVVVSLHFGLVYSDYPRSADQALARRICEAGAAVVLGHHPHVLQGFERWGDGVIAYSLGEFLFDPASGHVVNRTADRIRRESGVFRVVLQGQHVAEHGLRPCERDDDTLFPLASKGDDAARIAARVQKISIPLDGGDLDDQVFLRATARRTAEHQKDVFLHHLRKGHVGILARWLLRIRPRHLRLALSAVMARLRGD